MSGFSEINLPLSIIYSDVYSNVSGQVLEIDKALIPPGHLWSRLFATRVLIGDDYTLRGYITQKLIDLGYIAKAVYSPILPLGYLFLQSYESAAWFGVDAVEIDSPGPDELADDASFQTTEIEAPPEGSIVNFDITVPYGNWFILELSTDFCLGMQIDVRGDKIGDPTFLYEKRNKLRYPAITVPLSIPNDQRLRFTTEDNATYLLRVNDEGQLFWLRAAEVTLLSLFAPDGLFWLSMEPVLAQISDLQNVYAALTGNVKAFFTGTYRGANGNSGDLAFAWRTEDIAEVTPGTYTIPNNSSGDGNWSASGTLIVYEPPRPEPPYVPPPLTYYTAYGETALPVYNTTGTFSLSNQFKILIPATIVALRFYRNAAETATSRSVRLYTPGGTLLRNVTSNEESGSGWIEVLLPNTYTVAADTSVVVAVDRPLGYPSDNTSTTPVDTTHFQWERCGYIPTLLGAFPSNDGGTSNFGTDLKIS